MIYTHEDEVTWRWRASFTGFESSIHPVNGMTMLVFHIWFVFLVRYGYRLSHLCHHWHYHGVHGSINTQCRSLTFWMDGCSPGDTFVSWMWNRGVTFELNAYLWVETHKSMCLNECLSNFNSLTMVENSTHNVMTYFILWWMSVRSCPWNLWVVQKKRFG